MKLSDVFKKPEDWTKGKFRNEEEARCLIGGVFCVAEVNCSGISPLQRRQDHTRVEQSKTIKAIAKYLIHSFGEEKLRTRLKGHENYWSYALMEAKAEILNDRSVSCINCEYLITNFNDHPDTTFQEIKEVARKCGA